MAFIQMPPAKRSLPKTSGASLNRWRAKWQVEGFGLSDTVALAWCEQNGKSKAVSTACLLRISLGIPHFAYTGMGRSGTARNGHGSTILAQCSTVRHIVPFRALRAGLRESACYGSFQ